MYVYTRERKNPIKTRTDFLRVMTAHAVAPATRVFTTAAATTSVVDQPTDNSRLSMTGKPYFSLNEPTKLF